MKQFVCKCILNFFLVAASLAVVSCEDAAPTDSEVPAQMSIEPVHYQNSISVDSTHLKVSILAQGLMHPWEICWGPDDHLWVTDHNKIVARINPQTKEVFPLKVEDEYFGSEAGFIAPLGLAHHPNFTDSPFVYMSMMTIIKEEETGYLTVKRYTYDADKASLVNGITFLENIHTPGKMNPGGRLIISADHKLIIATSQETAGPVEVGKTEQAQDINSLSGKILRFNLDGTIPSDNPNPESYIWTMGHRNPQGLAVGKDGTLYASEHGPSNGDEINLIEDAQNYGWPFVSGPVDTQEEKDFNAMNELITPLKSWTPTIAPSSLAYYGESVIPSWQHSLLVTTLKESDLRVLRLNKAGDEIVSEQIFVNEQFGRLRDVAVAPDGRIYISTLNLLLDSINNIIRPPQDRSLEYDLIFEIRPE